MDARITAEVFAVWTGGHPASIIDVSYRGAVARSEEHTSELQSQSNVVCRPLLEKKTNPPRRPPRPRLQPPHSHPQPLPTSQSPSSTVGPNRRHPLPPTPTRPPAESTRALTSTSP